MNKIKNPLLVWLLLYSISFFSQTTVTGELQKWHTVAITFNGPTTSENSAANPFLDYRLNVTFSSPNGKTFVVPGFYAADGNAAQTSANSGNKWRVRFTPNEVGQWSYSASFRTGTNIAVSTNGTAGNATSFNGNSGNFNISASTKSSPDNRAKGRLNYVGERYLKFEESGKYFLKAGSDSPENLLAYNDFDNTVANKTWSPHAQDWRNGDPTWKGNNGKELIGAINYLAQKGMNAFSFLTMNVIGDGKDVWPWAALSNNNLDGNSGADAENRLRYDVSKLAQWEILFSHADAKGMYLHFKTQETENQRLLDRGNLGVQRKLYYRELIARFGHHLALNWNLGEEHDLYRDLNDIQNTRVKAYATFIKNMDPYDHNIVIHSYPGSSDQESLYRPLLGNKSDLTGASTQIQINTIHSDVKKWILESKNAGKQWVVANDEQGGAQSGVTADGSFDGSKGSQADNRKDTRHKVLWGTLMAGGAGVEYYFGYQTGETDLTAQNYRSRDLKWNDAKNALDFFNNHLSFWEMETHDEVTSSSGDYCLAKINDTYAIYLPNGGSTNLDLSNAEGSFTVKWYNPGIGGGLVKGSVTQLNGGGNRSIGNPPNNTSSDWVALVKNGEASGPSADKSCNLSLNATSDFENLSISGFSPAYSDNFRNALAINAAQFKDKFAAAETTFDGQTGTYNITLNTLSELDGESTYNLKINGTLVGTYTNPVTNTDYASAGTSFEDVQVNNGDTIRVEFNSHTNGKIPEGTSTAFSRGRWTSLIFECQLETSTPPTGDCDADAEEANGLVVIEAESLAIASGWEKSTTVNGFTGNGYIDWQGADSFGSPGNGKITAKIKINTPGTYLFQWRSKVGEGTNSTESNDSWLRFPDADDFFGQKGGSIVYPAGSGKTPNPEGASSNGWFKVFLGGTTNWTWASSTSDNDAHKIYVKFNTAGTYTMEVSGRSKHHLIDRIVLSKGVDATSLSLKETLCTGGDTTPVATSSVMVSPQTASVQEGNSLSLNAQVLPVNSSNKKVVWSSSNTSSATVNQNGVVVGIKKGDVVITATTVDGNFKSYASISVTEKTGATVPVSRIRVTPQQLAIEEGQTADLSYEVTPLNATNKNVTWSSGNPSIATVDQNGMVTALKKGTVEIEALSEDGGYRSDATVKVIPGSGVGNISVTAISISASSTTVVEGNSIILDYEIMPGDATNQAVAWSTGNSNIATVNQNGIVTALKVGEVVISVISKDGGFIGEATIKVIKQPVIGVKVQGIYVSPQQLTIEEGQTADLSYEVRPLNATNKNVTWSSGNPSIATVDQNGMVTALKKGTVEIEALSEDGGYRSDATIKVIPGSGAGNIAVTGVSISSISNSVVEGNSIILDYEIMPSDATNQAVTWSTGNSNIATVNQNGIVTALKVGEVVISVISKDGGFIGEATIKVIEQPVIGVNVQGIYVTPQQLTIEEGQTADLSYEVRPLNATNKNVIWRSGNPSIATVNQNGLVTALKRGTVEIEALSEDGGYRSDATVKVIPDSGAGNIAVTGVSISSNSTSVVEGNSIILDYDIMPGDARNQAVTWSTGNSNIATVNQNGIVTAIKVGEVVIGVMSEDGAFVSSITIKVTKKPSISISASGIYVTPQFLNLEEGETAVLSYTMRPSNASNKSVVWSSGDKSIATVDQNGVVTALRAGTVEIEATSEDGQYKSDSTVKIVTAPNSSKQAIIAYPNPTYDEVRIEGIQGETGWIGVYGFNGVLLKKTTVKGGEETVVSLAGYPAGSYVIKILDSDKITTKIVIKM